MGLLHVPGTNGAGDVGGHTARGADEAFAMGGEEVEVDARPVVVAVELSAAGQLQQIEVAGLVLGQQQQVGALAVELRVAVGHAPGGDVGLDADDGLDAGFLARFVERDDAEHRPVVGQGQRRLVERLGPRRQVFDAAEAVEQRELTMDVQMDKRLVLADGPRHGREYNTTVRIGA